jgi:hypothetical protein
MEFYNTYDFKDFQPLLHYSKQAYFRSLIWNITKSPDTLTRRDDSLTEDEWNKVHNTDFNTAYITIPLTRFFEAMEVLPIGNELSLRNVVNKIYEFYQKPLTKKQVEQIKSFPDDTFDYKKDLLKKAEMGEKVCYSDLRGDCVHFEGIIRTQANIYELRLGS